MFFYSKILSKFVLFIYYAMKSILEANSTNFLFDQNLDKFSRKVFLQRLSDAKNKRMKYFDIFIGKYYF